MSSSGVFLLVRYRLAGRYASEYRKPLRLSFNDRKAYSPSYLPVSSPLPENAGRSMCNVAGQSMLDNALAMSTLMRAGSLSSATKVGSGFATRFSGSALYTAVLVSNADIKLNRPARTRFAITLIYLWLRRCANVCLRRTLACA